MKNNLIFLTVLCFNFFNSCSKDMIEDNNLSKYYDECKQSTNDCEKQKNYYDNFPRLPEDFFNTFEYSRDINDSSYKSNNLYYHVSDYID